MGDWAIEAAILAAMRVVAGTARGRTLMAPPGSRTRPTSDRVRESIFNALYSIGDVIANADVLDVFAGSGALGIEALSRGAATATFVEMAGPALAVIRQNIDAVGFGHESTVIKADALDWLQRSSTEYDVVLCDPPYDFTDWPRLLSALERVVPTGVVVIESDHPVDLSDAWAVIRARRYGSTVVSIVHRRPSA